MNNFFSDAVLELVIDRTLCVAYVISAYTPVKKAIEMFKKHPSILKIKELGYEKNKISIQPITEHNVKRIINNIDSSKAYQKRKYSFSKKMTTCTIVLYSDINGCIVKRRFPNNLKMLILQK